MVVTHSMRNTQCTDCFPSCMLSLFQPVHICNQQHQDSWSNGCNHCFLTFLMVTVGTTVKERTRLTFRWHQGVFLRPSNGNYYSRSLLCFFSFHVLVLSRKNLWKWHPYICCAVFSTRSGKNPHHIRNRWHGRLIPVWRKQASNQHKPPKPLSCFFSRSHSEVEHS